MTVEQFERDLDENVAKSGGSSRTASTRPQANRRQWIAKPGSREKRPLGIPTVRDRVVETALKHVLEPIFERDFAEHSYGFRPGRGCKDALRRVEAAEARVHVWWWMRISAATTTRSRSNRCCSRVEEKVTDSRVLKLVEAFLKQEIMEEMKHWTPEEGTPQGAVISPLLSNIYLDPLDHLMARAGYEMVRYADDFVILCQNEAEARRALAAVEQWMAQAGAEAASGKDPDRGRHAKPGGFDFLGYHFERGYKWPRKKSWKKIKDTLRRKTKRTNGRVWM